MSYGNRPKYSGEMLDGILPEYERISKAPSSITEVPGFWEIAKQFPDRDEAARERDRFDNRFFASEKNKLYKALNYVTGEVFLMKNPLCRDVVIRNGVSYVQHPKPRKVGHINDLLSGDIFTGLKSNSFDI